MNIKILGSGREVGKSAILVDTGGEKFLWDFGIEVQHGQRPLDPPLDLKGIFLTHAHLDHSGCIPYLYKKVYKGPTYMTPASLDLCNMLLRDSIKVQKKKGQKPNFSPQDIKRMVQKTIILPYRKPVHFRGCSIQFRDAGHIQGAGQVLMEAGGKRILYTGDIKFLKTGLTRPADTDYRDIDALICEATYSYKDHPDRKELFDSLKEHIQYVLYNNGIVLLPSFAVGRTQEIIQELSYLGFPITMDGMGIEATKRILSNPGSVRDPGKLKKAFEKARKIKSWRQRDSVTHKACVIVCTAGMLQAGPVVTYIKKLHDREDCSLVFSGYQVRDSPGRTLLETGRYINEDIDVKPRMRMNFMDFSAHCGKSQLLDFFRKVRPKKIILVHTDHGPEFCRELRGMGFDAVAPENGETVGV